MPRIARIVAPGYPHHITQRGNRRQPTFFSDDDYAAYIELTAEWCPPIIPDYPPITYLFCRSEINLNKEHQNRIFKLIRDYIDAISNS